MRLLVQITAISLYIKTHQLLTTTIIIFIIIIDAKNFVFLNLNIKIRLNLQYFYLWLLCARKSYFHKNFHFFQNYNILKFSNNHFKVFYTLFLQIKKIDLLAF